jgi:hypothetical protein
MAHSHTYALSYIGVQILEDLAELAEGEGSDDTAMDVLIAAQLRNAFTDCPISRCEAQQGPLIQAVAGMSTAKFHE